MGSRDARPTWPGAVAGGEESSHRGLVFQNLQPREEWSFSQVQRSIDRGLTGVTAASGCCVQTVS